MESSLCAVGECGQIAAGANLPCIDFIEDFAWHASCIEGPSCKTRFSKMSGNKNPMKTLSVLALQGVAVVAVAATAAGCAELMRSDSANALHRNARANEEALAAAKAATRQAGAARPVAGDELVKLLSGKTHVREYRKRASDAKPYFTVYEYFSPTAPTSCATPIPNASPAMRARDAGASTRACCACGPARTAGRTSVSP
jgi:hypothetical protein